MILEMISKIKGNKGDRNDYGHKFKNIGFSLDYLPKNIKEKYLIYFKKENCTFYGFDCIALLLCNGEINDFDAQTTKNKYRFLEQIIYSMQ